MQGLFWTVDLLLFAYYMLAYYYVITVPLAYFDYIIITNVVRGNFMVVGGTFMNVFYIYIALRDLHVAYRACHFYLKQLSVARTCSNWRRQKMTSVINKLLVCYPFKPITVCYPFKPDRPTNPEPRAKLTVVFCFIP
jgi:hypothetical protein